jgi:hypothetical protein
VNFDQRQTRFSDDCHGVPEGVGVMREGGRIQDHWCARIHCLMQPADKSRLVVGLPKIDSQFGGCCNELIFEIGECRCAVDVWFAGSEAAEVGSVEDQYCRTRSAYRRGRRRHPS